MIYIDVNDGLSGDVYRELEGLVFLSIWLKGHR